MAEFTLIIGNRTYSSWSLRGWLACKCAGIDFDEVAIPLWQADTKAEILKHSPSGKVPALRHGKVTVWESLAIGEYLAEIAPRAGLWPEDRAARAHARSIAAEMHAGFAALRREMWMNIRQRFPGKGQTPESLADAARICAIWSETRARFGKGGPFLFGETFNMADIMFAPVVTRFVTWAPPLPADASAYVDAVREQPFMVEWRKAAEAEPWSIPRYDTA